MTTASKALRRIRHSMSDDSRGFEHSALRGAVAADHANVRRIVELEAAIAKALKKADANGMGDWPAFTALRKVMGNK